ncbi:MAG TPA: Hsp20/alpha crystallin family protein [Candidatus Limnocylindrales bacterium]|nr:Hsp20/alpha crystallin family protein [Candidatus Limnocylindrales bacterium]
MSLHSAMDRLFSDSIAGTGRRRGDVFGVVGEGFLPLDVYQTEKEWVIRAGVPNVDPRDVEIICDGNTIRISGEVKAPQNTKSENYWMRENYYGAFLREVTLPEPTVCEQSKAEFQNGMLVLTLPKAQPGKPHAKKIPVTSGSTNVREQSASTGNGDSASTATQSASTGNGDSQTTSAKEREAQTTGRK